MELILHLLVDARNVLYRAVYASHFENRYAVKYHCMVIFLRQFANWLTKFNPASLHIFWDAPRETVWRRKLLGTYKDRSSSNYIDNLSEILKVNTEIAHEIFNVLNARQYEKECMEADDLIYAAATVMHPKQTLIVSTDSDLTQIPFMLSTSRVYDPHKAHVVPTPKYHPAYMKAIAGDKADSIKGYKGIGEKKGSMLIEDDQRLQVFLDERGRDRFNLNLLITDLSLNPKLLANRLYIRRVLGQSVNYDRDALTSVIKRHKIIGMDSEYADIIPPFQRLN